MEAKVVGWLYEGDLFSLLSNQVVSKAGVGRAWSTLGGCGRQETIAKLQHCHFPSGLWTF